MTSPALAPFRDLDLDPKYDDYDFPCTAPEGRAGFPGHTLPEHDAAVFALRRMLEADGYSERLDTLTLLRFLRARKFNIEHTRQMFVKSEEWRREFRTDELVRTFVYDEKPQVFQYYPQYYHKTDIDGRPVYVEQLGKIDLNAMLKITTQDRMIKNLVCEYEKVSDPRLPACSRKAGRLLETCCTIMDLKGASLWKASSAYSYIKLASAISQNYYPERLGKLYVINAPMGFSSVWAMIKGWLDPVTVDKIHILGSNYKSALLEQVPAENLPVEFGGSCQCPGGCQFTDPGPWKDPKYARPAKWEKPAAAAADDDDSQQKKEKDDATIENPPSTVVNVANGDKQQS